MKPQITFILVRPRYPGNIGSVARVIYNMGFEKLSLVEPAVLPEHPEARRLAVGAEVLLKKAKVFGTIQEASHGMTFLVGTSRRTGKHRQDFVLLPDMPTRLPPGQKIGVLFGSEERGMTNKELAHCHLVTTIPSNPHFASLNLAQSVGIVAYQLRLRLLELEEGKAKKKATRKKATDSPPASNRMTALASVDQVEGMYEHFEKMLGEIGFFTSNDSFHMMRTFRGLFGRTAMTEREVRIFRGLCRQVLWRLKNV